MRGNFRCGGGWLGGNIGYPSERLFEEVAYVAYHFHWPYDQIMTLEHRERQRWVDEVASINRRLNEALKGEGPDRWR
jgi:hypothetical protein